MSLSAGVQPTRGHLPDCPFCGSRETEMIALFGQTLMTSQFFCRPCHSVFEAVRWGAGKEAPQGPRGDKTGARARR